MNFKCNATHSLGLEIELQLVDSETFALSNSSARVLENLPEDLEGKVKPELMQSYLEINTDVCVTVDDIEKDITAKWRSLRACAKEHGLSLLWAGTHPFSSWEDQKVTPDPRYLKLVELMQHVARRLVTYGMHVHVGVDSGDKAIMICDRLLRHLPGLLALSASSPLWGGRDTGLRSQRIKIMEGLPTAGLPQVMRNWSEYVWLIKHLTKTGFINSVREIWWDVRPHHGFGTVEVRIMDTPRSIEHTVAITALVQCIVAAISRQIDEGAYLTDCHPMLAAQNKWRAARFGLDASFVDPDTMQLIPARDSIRALMKQLMPLARELKCEHHLEGVEAILDGQNGAEWQLDVLHEHNSPRAVARELARVANNSI